MSNSRHHPGWPDRASARSGHRITTIAIVTAVASVILALTGCAAAGPGRIDDGRVRVVVSFYPPQFITEQVGGEDVSIINLTAPGASSHDVELRPSQIIALARADLVVYQGGFHPATDEAVQQNQPTRVVDAAQRADLEDGDPHFWLDPLGSPPS